MIVRFLADDSMGLWEEGDLADDLGWKTSGLLLRVLRLHRDGSLIKLWDPFRLGLIERVP